MGITFREGYIIFTLCLIAIDTVIAALSYRKNIIAGRYLGRSAVFAAVIAGSYLISILERNYFIASVMASIYFINIDWLLIALINFSIVLTTRSEVPAHSRILTAFRAVAVLDSIILAINPFKEIAVHYTLRPTIIACFEYQMMPLYYAHLIFTYIMVISVLVILMYKAVRTPGHYRSQYYLLTLAILVVVFINAIFLLPLPGYMSILNLIDSSIFGYSVGLIIMYWGCFNYVSGYLRHGLAEVVLDNFDQGVLLFDYDEFLVLKNEKAIEMIPALREYENHPEQLSLSRFLEICGIPGGRHTTGDHYSIQFFTGSGPAGKASAASEDTAAPRSAHDTSEEISPEADLAALGRTLAAADSMVQLRCDYTRLSDDKQQRVGDLFVLTSATEEIDLMTGYHSMSHFREFIAENPDTFRHPCAVAVFDINGLSMINREKGQEEGDRLIRGLSALIRQYTPEETYYVRGYDALLIAIAYFASEAEMMEYGQNIIRAFEVSTEAGYSSSVDESTDILALITEATRAMTIKKLLDDESSRSQTLSSLVRALKESDSDTEEHVKRTQKMGYELGIRFGLSDLQQSQLSLLCLLHDIGKVGIPLEILNKPGKLTDEEFAVLKTHAEKGYQIAISSWELRDIADMILYHHERWDGKGYPKGLSGDEIPFLSRIISVVDSYDAMISNRSYRKGRSPEMAQAELLRCSGTQFDAHVVAEFLKLLEEKPDSARDDTHENAEVIETYSDFGHGGEEIIYGQMAYGDVMDDIPAEAFESAAAPADELPHVSSHPVDFCKYIMNLNDYIISTDDNFETFTGYSREDVESGRLRQRNLIPEEDRDIYFEEVDKQLEKGNNVFMEHYLLRKDGRKIYIFCYARKFYHSASKTLRTEVVIVDMANTSMAGSKITHSDIEARYAVE